MLDSVLQDEISAENGQNSDHNVLFDREFPVLEVRTFYLTPYPGITVRDPLGPTVVTVTVLLIS